jgi:GT2 family glycosyltransferase
MPLAAKKNPKTEKFAAALIEEDPLPKPEPEEQPPAPKVTALIYSYNRAAALRRCIRALLASDTRAVLEILVVDKGSQDESPNLDSEFPETTFLRLPRNFGNTKALNIGMRTGVGEFVFFLDPEVEVRPDTISRLLQALEADADAMAVAPLLTDPEGAPVEQAYRLPTPQNGLDLEVVAVNPEPAQVPVEYASFQALLARKYFIRGINYLDDRYGEFGADAELAFQIKRAGRKTVVLPGIRAIQHRQPEPVSGAVENLLTADRVNGAAVYLGKHFGFMSGLTFRIGQIFKALLSFRFPLLIALVSGEKVDGSQSVVL